MAGELETAKQALLDKAAEAERRDALVKPATVLDLAAIQREEHRK
jgi:hypothetical protein